MAENSGGVHCLKYGLTLHNVLQVRGFTAEGEPVTFGGEALDAAGLDLLALAGMALFVGTLLFHVGGVLWDSITYRSISTTPLQVPQWIPQSLWFAGYLFFATTILVLGYNSLMQLRQQRWAVANALIGINSVEEEIREESRSSASARATTGEGR